MFMYNDIILTKDNKLYYKFLIALLLSASFLKADFLGGEINVGFMNEQPSGSFSYKGSQGDVENTFGWESQNSILVKVYLEHPIPILPNIRLTYTKLSHSGTGYVTNFTYGGKHYSGEITTDFDTDVIDGTLYYEILDNWISIDLGLNAKYIDGTASVENQLVGKSQADLSVVIPTLYANAKFDIPATNFSFQAQGDMISYSGNTLYDITLSARYIIIAGLGVEAGVKKMKLKLDDIDDITADVDFTGVYLSVVWDF